MKHVATAGFWRHYKLLPEKIRDLADKNFILLTSNPHHPSLHFKKVGGLWSARFGITHRALGLDNDGGVAWIWIGHHTEYDRLIR